MSTPTDLAKLLRQTHLTSPEEFLKASNAAIKKNKSDLTAQHTRVVALLNLDRYDDAVQQFEESDADKLKEVAKLEYAYALFKTGKWEDAVKVARSGAGEGNARGFQHVAAQTLYKLEEFEKAAMLYSELAGDREHAESEANDLKINGSAVDSQLELKGLGHLAKSRKAQKEDMEAFERAYNAACGCISRGELRQAEILLKRSKQLCQAVEDLSEEQMKSELLPILVQEIYVLSKQGKDEEARKLCESLPLQESSDSLTKYIALNNILAVTPSDNPFVAQRILQSVPRPSKGDAPFDHQGVTLTQNEYTVDLLAHKYPGIINSTAKKLASTPQASTDPKVNTLSVLNAAAHVRNETGKRAIKAMLPLLEKRSSDVGLLLTVIQLYVLTNNLASASNLLESFFKRLEQAKDGKTQAARFSPGLVGVAVSLYSSQGRSSAAKTLLVQAANYWKNHPSASGVSKASTALLLRAAGSTILLDPTVSEEDAKSAVSIFKELHTENKNDSVSIAGLVAAQSIAEPSESVDQSLVEKLTPVDKLIGNIDAEALESAGIFSAPVATPPSSKKKRPAPEDDTTQQKTEQKPSAEQKKKRKLTAKRMPKDYEEGKTMDPERWLPTRDRSYWRPKGKKGKARAAGLTQGGVVDEKTDSKAASGEVVGKTGGGGAKNKKKKVKGGKW